MTTVGFRQGLCHDMLRRDWDDAGPRPLAWSAWYPAVDQGEERPRSDSSSWFRLAPVARDAPIASSATPLPLVMLSHGSGASAAAMDWLAHRLARCGYVVLAINHHGHTGSEKAYRAEGFLCMWERASDLTALLDEPSWRSALGGVIADHAAVAGFSAGAYTAMLLVGARVSYSQFEPDNPVKSPIRGPREFPALVDELDTLLGNKRFRESWDRRRDAFEDGRFHRACAIAPGRSVLGFAEESLRAISKPVLIIGGDGDRVAPAAECCNWLDSRIKGSRLDILTGGVGHYTFLPEGSDIGVVAAPELFEDAPGLERHLVHDQVASLLVDFLNEPGAA